MLGTQGRNRLDTTNTRTNCALVRNFEQADTARCRYMTAAAKLAGVTRVKRHHAHRFTIFFTKKHHGTAFAGSFDTDVSDVLGDIFAYFSVDNRFDLCYFGIGDFRKVRKVEAQHRLV